MTNFGLIIFSLMVLITPVFGLENPEASLTKVIENYIITQKPELTGADIRVTYKFADKALKEIAGMTGKVKLEVLKLNQELNPVGQVIFPIGATVDGSTRKFFLRAQVEVFKDIIVAKQRIKRGAQITADDLIAASRDIALLPPKYFLKPEDLIAAEAKTNIPKDSAIFEWMVKPVPQVRRGDSVTIKVTGENIEVKSEGIALEDGYIGQPIRVRRVGSEKLIDAKLISPKEVEVIL